MIEITNEQKEQMANFWGSMITNKPQEFVVKEKYDELQQKINKAITFINIYIQVIEQQPTANIGNDDWILDRFKSIKSILQGDDKE